MKDIEPTKISEKIIFLIDLDGTLVDTNYANYLSYHYAVKQVLGIKLSYDENIRFTRSVLSKIFPDILKLDFKEIIRVKENKYKDFLEKTKINKNLVTLLQRYYKTNRLVLVTKSSDRRAKETLFFHNLAHYFSDKIFSKEGNKYKEAIDLLHLSVSSLIVFEDDDFEIENAIKVGIAKQNIQRVTF